jgi:PKD repeat protein
VPIASFYFYPSDPSILDAVQFNDQSYDPGQQQIQSQTWNFGDGTTATGCCPTHRYAADGTYAVHLSIRTADGRTGDTTRVVSVKTHDVGITKFQTPQSGSVGQTRQITVGIRNSRYPENVRVELSRGVPGSYYTFQSIGSLDLFVPVRPSNRTTDFSFSYTFTGDDGLFGKVTFKATATLDTARDSWQADNEAISLPTKVGGGVSLQAGPDAGPEVSSTASEARFALLGVKPNPALSGTDVEVQLSLALHGTAAVQVLDIAGRVMAERDLGSLGPGTHEVRIPWRSRPQPGIYWVRLTQAGMSESKRIGVLP